MPLHDRPIQPSKRASVCDRVFGATVTALFWLISVLAYAGTRAWRCHKRVMMGVLAISGALLATQTAPGGIADATAPHPPTHAAREECLSLHGTIQYGGPSWWYWNLSYATDDYACYNLAFLAVDGSGPYFTTADFKADGSLGLLGTPPPNRISCIAFRKSFPASESGNGQYHGEPTQWVWQAGLCTYAGSLSSFLAAQAGAGGASSSAGTVSSAGREECIALHGTIEASYGTNGECDNIQYVGSDGGIYYVTQPFTQTGALGVVHAYGAAGKPQCERITQDAAGQPIHGQWVYQAQICTADYVS